ncbi:hypothetical protein MTR_0017s0080 [Medicago truncatula]|uniref:Uncharacterized protein n=1 Tax=Medicago truncatula TaxID=3880 RepID=A0A072TJ23_MEDTR|nr:hypothetical protein MTR_0017s0080 [Medicago truncatula]
MTKTPTTRHQRQCNDNNINQTMQQQRLNKCNMHVVPIRASSPQLVEHNRAHRASSPQLIEHRLSGHQAPNV